MPSTTLATCVPYFPSGRSLGVTLLLLLVAKPIVYAVFVLCFRYRVSTPRPLSLSTLVSVVTIATAVGFGISFFEVLTRVGGDLDPRQAGGWLLLITLRLPLWFALGHWAIHLTDRRLVGWAFSALAIDLAFDLSVSSAFDNSWLTFLAACTAFVLFLIPLYRIGRRPSLKSRFLAAHFCHTCGYDKRGIPTARCPECGTAAS